MSTQAMRQVRSKAVAARVLTRAEVIRPYGPRTLASLVRIMRGYGLGLAGALGSAATRFPDRVAIVDERGPVTYRELDEHSNAVADVLASHGIGAGDRVALLARNHRGFVEAAGGAVKLGASVLLLNTSFSGPQIREVCEREGARMAIYDEEFTSYVDQADMDVPRMLSWVEDGSTAPDGVDTLAGVVARGSRERRPAPAEIGKTIILTSGTTGTPKGAARGAAHLDVPVGMLERIPFRSGWRTHVAAPMFHFWGLAQFMLGLMLGSTFVLTRRFDPQGFLETLEEHDCDAAVVIPVMLQRVLALPEDVRGGYTFPRLKVVAASGSALPGDLATAWMDAFGDNLYNTYGSTEVSLVSIATPEDMRALPGTAGRPAVSTRLLLLDEDGQEVAPGSTGRIFAGNSMLFEGYTGGGNKEVRDGLMSTGDVGRVDEAGRLLIEGRDDEMIVSGGENVFPKEVEDCLVGHPAVEEAAAIGVDDAEFGKRLRAFVATAGQVTEDDLKQHVKDNLARYKVPREILFLDELPRNATGKILKRDLAEWQEG
jgi:fatty-acyl-CoA synthase